MNNINSIPLGQLHWQQLKFLHFRRETTTNNNNNKNIINNIAHNVHLSSWYYIPQKCIVIKVKNDLKQFNC